MREEPSGPSAWRVICRLLCASEVLESAGRCRRAQAHRSANDFSSSSCALRLLGVNNDNDDNKLRSRRFA